MGSQARIRSHQRPSACCSSTCPRKQSSELRGTSRKHAFSDKDCLGRWSILGTHRVCMLYLEVKEDLDNTISGRPGPPLKCVLDFENI